MFSVTARARSARLQALTIRWPTPTATRSREHSFEAALTLAIRTALTPNGLRTALHTIQNTYRRTKDARGFTLSLDTTRSVVHAKLVIPRTRSLARFAATLRQEHLGSGRAMPSEPVPFGRRATRPKIRQVDDCNPTCQKQALVVSRGYRVADQSCPWRAAMSVAVHAAGTRFGRRFPRCSEHSPLSAPVELRHL